MTTKYYYGLKPNGRPLFIKNGEETEFSSSNSDRVRNEGNIFGIQLLDTTSDDKEYIFAVGNNNAYIELYDFSLNDPVVSKVDGNQFFSSEYNSFKYGTLIKLKNSGNIYILSLILQHSDHVKHFNIMKLSFSSNNINTSPIQFKWDTLSQSLSFSSCFEDDSSNIICFYIDNYNVYTLKAFNYDLSETTSNSYTSFANAVYSETILYKGIHFTGVVGAFIYFNSEGKICIQFLKYESNNFNNYFQSSGLNPLKFDNPGYSTSVQRSDFIRIADKHFCYIAMSEERNELHLYTFKNFVDEQFIIRHYSLETKK